MLAEDAMDDGVDSTCQVEESLQESLPEEHIVRETVELLKGFADATRLKILCLLRGREICVHEIVEALDVSQSAVSHQLRTLRNARLVAQRREGRHVYYRLADTHVEEMLENALSHGEETA